VNFGVPAAARCKRAASAASKTQECKRFTDIDQTTARKTLAELAKAYGADEAVEMVKAYPQALVFSLSRFCSRPCCIQRYFWRRRCHDNGEAQSLSACCITSTGSYEQCSNHVLFLLGRICNTSSRSRSARAFCCAHIGACDWGHYWHPKERTLSVLGTMKQTGE